jgi:acyl-CoA synthetase (AMP-forming)/AMP-acid ligase II
VSLNWLNLDHIGSLIRCCIKDIYLGSQQIHAPAEIVLEDPLRWLDWIEQYQVTFAWAPNFALGLVNSQADIIAQK